MKQQENNFQYKSIVHIGFWEKDIPEINTKPLIRDLYKYKSLYPSALNSNKGGYQTDNDLHLAPEFSFLVNFLNNTLYQFIQKPNIIIESMWGNISSYTHSNGMHTHSFDPYKLSGILYLKTPLNSGDLIFKNPIDINHSVNYVPQQNKLLIFPSTLPHLVGPNLSQEDRISIAFNFS